MAYGLLLCRAHGSHPEADYPRRPDVSEADLRAWLASAQRTRLEWDMLTGIRLVTSEPFGAPPGQRALMARALWLRHCRAEKPTDEEIARALGCSRNQYRRLGDTGLRLLRAALRDPSRTPAVLAGRSRLRYALYGCERAPVLLRDPPLPEIPARNPEVPA